MGKQTFVMAKTNDDFATEKIDVIQQQLLGDYDDNNNYIISDNIISELVSMRKQRKSTYNNYVFLNGITQYGRIVNFQLEFNKNSTTGKAMGELFVLEPVNKQGGRLINTLKTSIAKYVDQFDNDFTSKVFNKFNVSSDSDNDGKDDYNEAYIQNRELFLNRLNDLTVEEYNSLYEDYFTQRINMLRQSDDPYALEVLAIFDFEFSKISKHFLTKKDKKTDYKAMNELLDKCCEDVSGLDKYQESEKKFKKKTAVMLDKFKDTAGEIKKVNEEKVIEQTPELKTAPQESKDKVNDIINGINKVNAMHNENSNVNAMHNENINVVNKSENIKTNYNNSFKEDLYTTSKNIINKNKIANNGMQKSYDKKGYSYLNSNIKSTNDSTKHKVIDPQDMGPADKLFDQDELVRKQEENTAPGDKLNYEMETPTLSDAKNINDTLSKIDNLLNKNQELGKSL